MGWKEINNPLIVTFFVSYVYSANIPKHQGTQSRKLFTDKNFDFHAFLKKFEPKSIWERIDKKNKYESANITKAEQRKLIYMNLHRIHDELLAFDVKDLIGAVNVTFFEKNKQFSNGSVFHNNKGIQGISNMTNGSLSRRVFMPDEGWTPPASGYQNSVNDPFFMRERLLELMKQAIYQSRNKMILMQEYREKYKTSALYKMGFLMSRTDRLCKVFGKVSDKAFRNCLLSTSAVQYFFSAHHLLHANQRQLQLWFNIDLMVELIKANDENCKDIFKKHTENRKEKFDEIFID